MLLVRLAHVLQYAKEGVHIKESIIRIVKTYFVKQREKVLSKNSIGI